MQTLRLSGSTAQPDNRLRSLFWPSVGTSSDVDYLGAQGYWVCAVVAIVSAAMTTLQGHWVAGIALFLFYYVGGVGVREASRYAATVVLVIFLADFLVATVRVGPSAVVSPSGVIRVLITALFLANLRATWIASRWRPDTSEATPPPRFGETLGDKFVDRLPAWLWPKVRVVYYIFSAGFLILVVLGIVMALFARVV